MYLVRKQRGNRVYFYLYQSVRDRVAGGVKHKSVLYLGVEPVVSEAEALALAHKGGVSLDSLRAIKDLVIVPQTITRLDGEHAGRLKRYRSQFESLGSLVSSCESSSEGNDQTLAQFAKGIAQAVEEDNPARINAVLEEWDTFLSLNRVHIAPHFVWDTKKRATVLETDTGGHTWHGIPEGSTALSLLMIWLENGCKPEIGVCRACDRVYVKSSGQRQQRYCSTACARTYRKAEASRAAGREEAPSLDRGRL